MKKLILTIILLLTFTNFIVNAEENKTTCDEISISNLFRFYSDKQEKVEEMLKNKKICDKNTDEIMQFTVYDKYFNEIKLEDYTGKENTLIYIMGKKDDKINNRLFLNDKEVFQMSTDNVFTIPSISRYGNHVLIKVYYPFESVAYISNYDKVKTGLYIDGVKIFNGESFAFDYFLENTLDYTFKVGEFSGKDLKVSLTLEEIEKLDNIAKKYDNYSQEKIDKDMGILWKYLDRYRNGDRYLESLKDENTPKHSLYDLNENELKNFLKINYVYSELKIKELKKMEF